MAGARRFAHYVTLYILWVFNSPRGLHPPPWHSPFPPARTDNHLDPGTKVQAFEDGRPFGVAESTYLLDQRTLANQSNFMWECVAEREA